MAGSDEPTTSADATTDGTAAAGPSDDDPSGDLPADGAGDGATFTHSAEVSPSEATAVPWTADYDSARVRAAYGPLRAWLRSDPERFARLQRWLDAARLGVTYDDYLSRALQWALLGSAGGLLAGLVLFAAVVLGVVTLPLGGVAGAALLGGGVVALGLLGGGGTLLAAYYRPAFLAHRRGQTVDAALPHAVIFLYALTHGGESLFSALTELADAEEVYGPVAAEFGVVVDEMQHLDSDLYEAIERVRDRTASHDLAAFLDELGSVLETGGDVDSFLADAAESQLEEAESKQEELLNDLGMFAEIYVSTVFAGPVFLMVVFLVASFATPGFLRAFRWFVYLGVPLLVGVALLGFDWFVTANLRAGERLGMGVTLAREGADSAADFDGRLDAYRRVRWRHHLRDQLANPVESLRERPLRVLALTLPLTLLVVGGLVLAGLATPTRQAMLAEPVRTTLVFLVLPFLLSATPFAVVHWLHRRHDRTIQRRLPGALFVLADADHSGVPLANAFDLVSRRAVGPLADELRRVHNDLTWRDDIAGALRAFADRLNVGDVTRVVRLLDEAIRTTDDLAPVLSVVAEDLDGRNDLRRERRRETSQYVILVCVGVFVFLGIVAVFDVVLLPALMSASSQTHQVSGRAVSLGGASMPTYRRLLFHAALVQAVGNGLLLGKLTDDRIASGIKYAVLLVASVGAVFLVLPLV